MSIRQRSRWRFGIHALAAEQSHKTRSLVLFLHRAVVAAVSLLTPPDGGGFDEHANASVGT